MTIYIHFGVENTIVYTIIVNFIMQISSYKGKVEI
jgi:hypothetical protein